MTTRGVSARTKGASGEREIINLLKPIIDEADLPFDLQRNLQQWARGGSDIRNPWGLSFEIKRQETLKINEWWSQCCYQADLENAIPILIFRQNRKPWQVMKFTNIALPNEGEELILPVIISFDNFKKWLTNYLKEYKNKELG